MLPPNCDWKLLVYTCKAASAVAHTHIVMAVTSAHTGAAQHNVTSTKKPVHAAPSSARACAHNLPNTHAATANTQHATIVRKNAASVIGSALASNNAPVAVA